ncbi:MAG: VWA domain-containing protein [Bryobacteraceae bacterium]|jgi:Ca-activated chloride channel family protein
MLPRIGPVFALCALLPLAALPQQPAPDAAKAPPQEPPPGARFTVQSNEVILPVTVTDDKGRFVSNLDAKDFLVLDEGKPQRLTYFSHNSKQAIVVGFLVDLSNSSRIYWKTFQDATMDLVWNLLPVDDPRFSGYLITYANDAEVAVNTTQDADKITDVLRKSKPGGASAFYDAILLACTNRTLVHGEPYEPRRVLIVIGDGHDTASKKISFDQVVELAKRNLVTIYAISTQSFGFSNRSEDELERLTHETGGHVEYPLNKDLYKDVSGYISVPKDAGNYVYEAGTGGYAAEISGAITRAILGISGDITSQYILRYVPEASPDAKLKAYHHIKVEIPSVPGVVIRTRDGYYPATVPSQPTGAQ